MSVAVAVFESLCASVVCAAHTSHGTEEASPCDRAIFVEGVTQLEDMDIAQHTEAARRAVERVAADDVEVFAGVEHLQSKVVL